MKTLSRVLLILLLGSVCYFSWLPSPDLKQTGLLPAWLGKWTDENGNIRTGVPFLGIGLLAGYLQLPIRSVLGFALVGLVLVESVQLALPLRHFDWWDVVYGFLGLVLGLLGYYVIKKIIN